MATLAGKSTERQAEEESEERAERDGPTEAVHDPRQVQTTAAGKHVEEDPLPVRVQQPSSVRPDRRPPCRPVVCECLLLLPPLNAVYVQIDVLHAGQ